MSKNHTGTSLIIGAITASIGGVIKYNLAMSGFEWADGGILLPFYLCLLTPIIGGLLGWTGVIVAQRISNSRTSVFIGGLLGGFLTILILLPAPYIPQ